MEPLQITVTLDLDAWAEGQHYQDLEGDWQSGPPGPLESWVATQVVATLANRIQSEVKSRITGGVVDATLVYANEMVREALAGPVRKTDGYGNPRGEPTTLHELVLEQVQKALGSHREYMGRRTTLLDDVIKEEVTKTFTAELKPVIAEAKAAATKAVRDRAAEMLAKEMQPR